MTWLLRLQGFVDGLPGKTSLPSNPSRTDTRPVRIRDALAHLGRGGVTLVIGCLTALSGAA